MPNKSQIKGVVFTAAGVILAGWLMHQFRDVSFVAEAQAGYGG